MYLFSLKNKNFVLIMGKTLLIFGLLFSQSIEFCMANVDIGSGISLSKGGADISVGSEQVEKNKSGTVAGLYSQFVNAVTKIERKYDYQHYKVFKQFMDRKPPATDASAEEQKKFITENITGYETVLSRISQSTENQLKEMLSAWSHVPVSSFYMSFLGFNPALISQLYIYDRKLKEKGHEGFIVDPARLKKIAQFLRLNITSGGMPLSFFALPEYWKSLTPLMNNVDALMERLLIRYGLSIYDGALWQIALTISGNKRDIASIHEYTERLLNGSSGKLDTIRAYGPIFKYGETKTEVTKNHGFFFRIIADEYLQEDPLYEDANVANFPNFQTPHHEDWKPITGEQAWAAIIGPLQVAHFRYNGRISIFSDEVKLALSVLPTIEIMQSEIGAIYHAPGGTHGKNPHDISNENNFSMYAALNMLYDVVRDQDPIIAARILKITQGQERYFEEYSFDKERKVFYQGGYYVDGKFIATNIFATDCQTWGILALGPKWIDDHFGKGTSYEIWQNTKRRSGYINQKGDFEGIGFTDGHRILSVEWTCGGILATKVLADEYKTSHPSMTKSCKRDILSMRDGMERYKVELLEGSLSYLYSNRRFFIPFGWWANPIPCIASSAWILIIDLGFNPFVLGGGKDFHGTTIYDGLSPEERYKKRPHISEAPVETETLHDIYAKQPKTTKVGVIMPMEETTPRRSLTDAEREALLRRLKEIKGNAFDYSLLYQWLMELLFKQPSFTMGTASGVNIYDWTEKRQIPDRAKELTKHLMPKPIFKKTLHAQPATPIQRPAYMAAPMMTQRLFQNEVEEVPQKKSEK